MKLLLLTILTIFSAQTFAYNYNYQRLNASPYIKIDVYKVSTCKDMHADLVNKLKNRTLELRNGFEITFVTRDSFECLEAKLSSNAGRSNFVEVHFVKLGQFHSWSDSENYIILDFANLPTYFGVYWSVIFLSLEDINWMVNGKQVDVEVKQPHFWNYISGRL